MKKALVTGDLGLVGSHMRRALEQRGYFVSGLDIKRSCGEDAAAYFRESTTKFDLVVHCAANVGGRQSFVDQPWRLFNNFVLDSELFQWALRTRPEKIVYYSSSAAYPMRLQMADELTDWLFEDDIELDDVCSPDPSIYGWSKLTGEQLAHYASLQGLKIWIFRPFSGYSEKQSLDYPFPSFINRAVKREDPFIIWGDGTQVRDWIHIDDIIEGTLQIVDTAPPDCYNLGTGKGTSMNDLVAQICTAVGYKPTLRHLLDKPVGVMYRVAEPSKMRKFFVPRIDIGEGIRRALENK
jgi:nucleoside-diphosphate-sugar epimerase